MRLRQIFTMSGFIAGALLALAAFTGQTLAQGSSQNPTPIVITLTPAETATTVPSPTSQGLPPDRFEPNNTPETAAPIGFGVEAGLTLAGDDVDYFTVYLKAGQMVRISTAVYQGLDTRLKLFWAGQVVAENEDRSPVDLGSTVHFTAVAEGWHLIRVEKAAVYDGVYDLEVALVQPAATPTPAPTLTPTPTPTPSPSPTPLIQPDLAEPNDTSETAFPITPGVRGAYTVGGGDVDYYTFIAKAGRRYACETVTNQVDTLLTATAGPVVLGINDDRGVGRVDSYVEWQAAHEQVVIVKVEARGGSYGQYDFVCQVVTPPAAPPSGPSAPPVPAGATATPAELVTGSLPLTATEPISLTVHHLGRVQPQTAAPTTHIRLLVYYDANNDRQPGPGEGIANVSVLAVNSQGQPLARVFTNAQGEAVFNLAGDGVARVIVPFVPGWSARVRVGETNNDIVLGLPAVRLPVFLPVERRVGE
jgi:hypothetical protein